MLPASSAAMLLPALKVLVVLTQLIAPSLQDIQSGVQAVTTFSNNLVPKLFQALAPGRENLVFAPFGLATNVAMMLEAADSSTAREILTAFNIAADGREELRIGFKAYFDTFEHAASTTVDEAAGAFNMAMMRTNGLLSPTYKSLLAKYYRVNITEVASFDNFTGVQPAGQVLELRSDSGVMSHWKDYQRLGVFTFLSHQAAAAFHRTPTQSVTVPMIPQVGVFRSGRVDHLNCQAIELLLEVGSVNLLLLVPDSSDAMDELLVKLSGVSFHHLVHWLTFAETEVSLPQLTVLSSGLDLAPFLRQLGVRSVFNASAADLNQAVGKTPQAVPVYVKSVTQDAYFSTSFVAVNSVGSVSSNFVSKRPKREAASLIVDRPFLFFLLHRDTQLVLLAGKVQNPTQVP